ncbi:uridine kinase [Isoptericola sp. b408]|uniref:uridine kinase n=1 Tax=Isoptericola sp. b408 TaxID=3064653 RepID=UPI002713E625|nr:uridine kinase [Isoptericola sp. b408]MDO8150254.1 uridine kinase [Isoptericola sp. b408]
MHAEPTTPDAVVAHVVDLVLSRPADRPVRLVVDGHPSTRPEVLADALVGPLEVAGRPVARVRVRDFWRPASLRLEQGRRDPDALLDDWVDVGGLNREVLTAVVRRGRWLPSLRDPVTDRPTRADRVDAAPGTVVVLDGSLTLGRGLDVDLSVHLALRPATETRNTPLDEAWRLAAYTRYRREVAPERRADVVVRVDHPDRPALLVR